MFSDLHEFAQTATLLIIVTADADQLHVRVTPTQVDDKTNLRTGSMQPLPVREPAVATAQRVRV
jgi:hypothetical protein